MHVHRGFARFVTLLALFRLQAVAAETVAADRSQTPVPASAGQMAWFRDAKFGMFIHWGPAAISGEEISWGMKDRIERGGQQHQKVEREDYLRLYERFDPVKFDPGEWARLAKAAGMRYVVFVTKHHDGFSLFDTRQVRWRDVAGRPAHYSIADTPYRKDLCRELADAVHGAGLRLGWYYSTRDWTHPDYLAGDNRAYNDYYQAQVRELLRGYGKVDLMWFDHAFGRWDQYTIPDLFRRMYADQPDLLVNDRSARGLDVPAGWRALARADFDTPENRMGTFQPGRAWESCMILSPHADHGGWSYRPDGKTRPLASVIQLLSSAACGDGNLLLNIAPMPSGEIRPEELAVLRGLAPWTAAYGEAIYGTRGGPWVNGAWGGSTYRGDVVYVHARTWRGNTLRLTPLTERITAAELLTARGPVAFTQNDAGVDLVVDQRFHDPTVTLIRLTLDRPVSGIQTIQATRSLFEDPEYGGRLGAADSTADLGGVREVRGVRISLPASAAPRRVTLALSADGTTWSEVWRAPSDGTTWEAAITAEGAGAEVLGRTARFVKVVDPAATGATPTAIHLEVFGR